MNIPYKLEKGKVYNVAVLGQVNITKVENPVRCGFPSPAQDYLQRPIDLNDILVSNEPATFLFIAEGDSMKGRNIVDGSMLVIDKSITPKNNDVVLAEVNGEYTLKVLDTKLKRLMPANPAFEPIQLGDGVELRVCGVVTYVITSVKG